MPKTVLDFPQVTSVQRTDQLYIVRGSGPDRDKRIDAGILDTESVAVTLAASATHDLSVYKGSVLMLVASSGDAFELTLSNSLPAGRIIQLVSNGASNFTLKTTFGGNLTHGLFRPGEQAWVAYPSGATVPFVSRVPLLGADLSLAVNGPLTIPPLGGGGDRALLVNNAGLAYAGTQPGSLGNPWPLTDCDLATESGVYRWVFASGGTDYPAPSNRPNPSTGLMSTLTVNASGEMEDSGGFIAYSITQEYEDMDDPTRGLVGMRWVRTASRLAEGDPWTWTDWSDSVPRSALTQRSLCLENPVAGDNIFMFVAYGAVTAVNFRAAIVGGTNVVWRLYKDASRDGAGTGFTAGDVTTTTKTTPSTTANTTAIADGEVVFVRIVSVSGAVTQFNLTLNMFGVLY